MARNWLRRCSLVVAGGTSRDLSALRVVFKIEANSVQSPNMARFRVYNVSPTTEAQFKAQEFATVSFSAGYEEGNYGLVYQGDIKQTIVAHETVVDRYIEIYCADGGQGYISAHVNATLASGYTPQDKFDAALKSLSKFGITKGNVTVDLSQPKYPRGLPMFGMARDILRDIATSNKTLWSIQDGKIDMLDPAKPPPGGAIVMNSQTGMIGWPQQTQDGIIVKSLLNPNLRPNKVVQINQNSIQQTALDSNPLNQGSQGNQNLQNTGAIAADGMYKVYNLERAGDTRGQDWYDTSTCIATTSSPNPGQLANSPIQAPYLPPSE